MLVGFTVSYVCIKYFVPFESNSGIHILNLIPNGLKKVLKSVKLQKYLNSNIRGRFLGRKGFCTV